MQWTDDAVILGARRHGEGSLIVDAMTRAHGRHLGLARAGRGGAMAAALQPGNGVRATWRGRLDEHLGNFTIEPVAMRAGGLMGRAAALYALGYLCALTRLLPEREPHESLHDALCVVLDHLDEPDIAGALVVRTSWRSCRSSASASTSQPARRRARRRS